MSAKLIDWIIGAAHLASRASSCATLFQLSEAILTWWAGTYGAVLRFRELTEG